MLCSTTSKICILLNSFISSPRPSLSLFPAQLLAMLLHGNVFVLFLSPLVFAFTCYCCGTQFNVGVEESSGWTIPPYSAYYTNWSLSHLFKAGDSLEFKFDTKYYNLVQVTQQEYKDCTSIDPVKVFNSSPAIIPLTQRGDFYFICNISNNCCLGQKIAVTVHECSAKNPPSPSPSPSGVPVPPLLPPKGSAAPPKGAGGYSPRTSPMPYPGSNGGYSPEPTTDQGEKSMAIALVHGTSFSASIGEILSVFASLLGFWVI